MPLQASRDQSSTLVDVIDRVLDKGLVINADICVSVAGVELLGIKIRAALASFETAATVTWLPGKKPSYPRRNAPSVARESPPKNS
jgi:hypothetical protein